MSGPSGTASEGRYPPSRRSGLLRLKPVGWKLLIVGGGWVSWESKPARLKSSSPELAGRIRAASLPWEGRPLVRLDDEQGAFALSMQVLEELGLRAKVG